MGISLAADERVLQDEQHGEHEGVRLPSVLLLNAAHNEGIGILDASLLQHFQLCGLPSDQGELTGRFLSLLLGHALQCANS